MDTNKEMEDKRLYRLRTVGHMDFYVIASSFDEAAKLVEKRLGDADYGYSSDRVVANIELLGVEHFYSYGNRDKQCFSGEKCNLIVKKEGEL